MIPCAFLSYTFEKLAHIDTYVCFMLVYAEFLADCTTDVDMAAFLHIITDLFPF